MGKIKVTDFKLGQHVLYYPNGATKDNSKVIAATIFNIYDVTVKKNKKTQVLIGYLDDHGNIKHEQLFSREVITKVRPLDHDKQMAARLTFMPPQVPRISLITTPYVFFDKTPNVRGTVLKMNGFLALVVNSEGEKEWRNAFYAHPLTFTEDPLVKKFDVFVNRIPGADPSLTPGFVLRYNKKPVASVNISNQGKETLQPLMNSNEALEETAAFLEKLEKLFKEFNAEYPLHLFKHVYMRYWVKQHLTLEESINHLKESGLPEYLIR